ncbi:hypothetical protein MNBD_GAMMA22-1941 [hydrothermal vent metagenome]|uniref:ResB-like domain-containing protein n=1 Tax=hydrothermal vent metagenome TaxID=652676 RepID=A0A3B1ABI7_9ZZZZ
MKNGLIENFGKVTQAALASNRLNLSLLIVLFFAVILYQQMTTAYRLVILLIPVALLMLKFILALVLRKIVISNPVLLIFHMALFALVSLAIVGQFTYLKATLELSTQEEFNGRLENIDAGPWHNYQLDKVKFTNLGFSINYHKGIMRDSTRNRIQLGKQIVEIGDHVPLVIGHYRFYTTHNKGYAPLFRWIPADGSAVQLGNIHLPAYPIHEYQQAKEWTLPQTQQKIWTMLVIEEDLLPEDRDFNFRVSYKHHLIIRIAGQRYVLRQGDEIKLPEGILRYDSLVSWMGYTVDYDWTRPWLFAASLIALLSLFFYYFARLKN